MASSEKTPMHLEVAELIVDVLNLEDVAPDDIDLDAPLFNEGLGLDSIDALELSLEISQRYGFQIKSDDPDIDKVFGSLRQLAETIESRRSQ
ncbi:MAG: acyl carrier protein [Rhodospirillales bacterium]|nr:acyl carrier protein [Rhodospirillales bacterium]